MDDRRKCRCPICQLEQKLLSWPPDQTNPQEFQRLVSRFPAPVQVRSTIDFLSWLHQEPPTDESTGAADQLIRVLLQPEPANSEPIHNPLLILIFIPIIHRTYKDICFRFPAMEPEDVAQQTLTIFLERCQARQSSPRIHHVSVSLARRFRNDVFRWAVDENRNSALLEPTDNAVLDTAVSPAEESPEEALQLEQLLDHCQKQGGLSNRDRALLAMKVEGVAARDIARLSGRPTSIAVHRRVQRIVVRLRRTASTRSNPHDNTRKPAERERALGAQASA